MILPTPEQGLTCIDVCQMLSNCYRAIELFQFSDITGDIYIFAGEDLQLMIDRQGKWNFIDET